MILATSITPAYLEPSQSFFKSAVQYWPGRRICFTIGFTTTIEGWETIEVQPLHSWRPTNRTDYYSLQHGEFIQYLTLDKDEMILFTDSDMVLQRLFDLDMPPTHKVLATQCSYPQKKIYEVVANLKCKRRADKFFNKYHAFIEREFCACWMLTSVRTWQIIYRQCQRLYPMLKDFEHHAAWQLLINIACKDLGVVIAPAHICNASWYEGTEAVLKDREIWIDGLQGTNEKGEPVTTSEKVYFNHTKFNV